MSVKLCTLCNLLYHQNTELKRITASNCPSLQYANKVLGIKIYLYICVYFSLHFSFSATFASFYCFCHLLLLRRQNLSTPVTTFLSFAPLCTPPPPSSLLFLHSSFDSFASPEEQKSFFLFFRPSGCLAARSQPPFLTRNRVLTELRPSSDLGRARSKSDNLKSPFTIPATLAIILATFTATAATPTRPLDLSRRFK